MARWVVKGGIIQTVDAAATVQPGDDAGEAVKRGRGRPKKPPVHKDIDANGDQE